MLQQVIALAVILYFLARLFLQRRKNQVGSHEFMFWLAFWLVTAAAILSIKQIDRLVQELGFSGSGIDVLLYIAVALLFYFIIRLRFKVERIERNLTKIIRELAIKDDSDLS